MGHDWQLRKEARRCTYNAMTAENPGERKMFNSLSLFYSVLAETDLGDNAKPRQPRHRANTPTK